MARITKSPEQRRGEIMDASQRLFISKGFIQTSVGEIVRGIGVAQGTFYYYFKTKEEVVDAIVDRHIQAIADGAAPIVDNPALDPFEKMRLVAMAELQVNFRNLQFLHRISSVDIHVRILKGLLGRIAPLYARIIQEGIAQGLCRTGFPLETMEAMIVNSHILFDRDLFPWTAAEFGRRLDAHVHELACSLAIDPARLGAYRQVMAQIYDGQRAPVKETP